MSEQTCEGALEPYGAAALSNVAGWREAVTAAVTQAWTRLGATSTRCGQPCINRTAATLAGLNDHTLADIGIHRSQIPAFARAVTNRSQEDPRCGNT